MFAGINLAGAGQRLLPERIPMRFFGVAVAAHVIAWLALAATAPGIAVFAGGLGPEVAAVHVLTMGVLLATAMGASMQMLPVALSRQAPPVAACEAVFWPFVAGGVAFIGGTALFELAVLAAGAALVAIGIAVYAVLVARTLIGHHGQRVVVLHVWTALASLVSAGALAVALALDAEHGILPDHGRAALAHALLAGYGFMGFLALGFSHILLPMFAIAQPPQGRLPEAGFWTAAAALAAGVGGALAGSTAAILAAAALGGIGAGLHVWFMAGMLRSRMRKRLGPEFVLFGASWALLAASLVAGAAAALGFAPETAPALFGFLLLYGWLLTLLVGVLQRILPFLASMHTARGGKAPATPTALTAERPLAVHRACHLTAVPVAATGIAFDLPFFVAAGAAVGAVGAACFAWFALTVAVRARAHIRQHAIHHGSPTS